MASNPVFNRIEKEAERGYAGFGQPRGGYPATPGYGPQDSPVSQQRLEDLYNRPSAGPVETGRVTMDDVVMKSLTLFAIVLVTATASWILAASSPVIGATAAFGGMIATLVLGLVIAFKKSVSVPLIVTYAVIEGVFLGAVSQFFEARYGGIVGQAVLGTLSVFVGMFLAYRFGLVKVTAKFRRIMTFALIGYAIFALVNFVFAAFISNSPFGFGGTGPLGIGISLFAVGLAAFTLALDFDSIEYAISAGAPQKYSWLLAHGLIVTLVWLYIEMLRLLARLRSE